MLFHVWGNRYHWYKFWESYFATWVWCSSLNVMVVPTAHALTQMWSKVGDLQVSTSMRMGRICTILNFAQRGIMSCSLQEYVCDRVWMLGASSGTLEYRGSRALIYILETQSSCQQLEGGIEVGHTRKHWSVAIALQLSQGSFTKRCVDVRRRNWRACICQS